MAKKTQLTPAGVPGKVRTFIAKVAAAVGGARPLVGGSLAAGKMGLV